MENKDWNTRSSFSSVSTRESTIVTYFDKEATSDPIFSKLDVLEFSVKLIPRWHCYVCVQKCRSKPPFLSLSICEPTKKDIFIWIFAQKRSSVNGWRISIEMGKLVSGAVWAQPEQWGPLLSCKTGVFPIVYDPINLVWMTSISS